MEINDDTEYVKANTKVKSRVKGVRVSLIWRVIVGAADGSGGVVVR